eukprot:2616324-Prorocentrum_lima.AAC.1
MQHYMTVQYLTHKDDIYQSSPCPRQGGQSPIPGQFKATVAQPVEGNMDWSKMTKDQIMTAL